ELKAHSEFRFESNTSLQLVLKRGTAEIFGTELAIDIPYNFNGVKLAVYTYHGAALEITGETIVEYTSEETPMPIYYNLHLALEQRRMLKKSPRILLIGSGRNTASKILANYAVRMGRSPLYIDLDVTNGSTLFPGTMNAFVLDKVVNVEEGCPSSTPLSYFYGQTSISTNMRLYKKIIAKMATVLYKKLEQDEALMDAGMIIIAPKWSDSVGFEILQHIIEAYQVTVVAVLGNERLYSEIIKKNKNEGVEVLKVPKSGGVIDRDVIYRRQEMSRQINRYFYKVDNEFTPYSLILNYKDVSVKKISEEFVAPTSALPIGATRIVDDIRVVDVEPSSAMNHMILALSACEQTEDEEAIAISNVFGYMCVTEIDDAKQRMTLLVPCYGKLPKPYILVGNMKWIDHQ
ncbi:Clp1-domain-containing protein, partial [Rozella allomycis CSF55]